MICGGVRDTKGLDEQRKSGEVKGLEKFLWIIITTGCGDNHRNPNTWEAEARGW